MSYNSRQRSAGPWRDQYYPYQGSHDQWQASNDAYYGYNNNDGYEDGQYYAPSSSQSNDYYYRNTYEDTNQYGYSSNYSATEHQPARYDEHNYYREDRHPSPSRREWRDRRERDYGHARPKESVSAPYRHERDDRPVTPPPPRSPSPSYLKLANSPPESLHSSTEERKLLILDLNGTLVHRSALARPKNKHAPQPPPELDGNGRPLPRLRPVHPRPYMNAFRSYLFAPETRAWLDVMVWSSAQPHSVGDMVERCFAAEKKKLLAVWARDTLGLNKDHYYRKVQTVKDLNTPWSKLASISDPHDSEASSGDESAKHPPSRRSPVHSALTTLLLDDSPRKAELQPYNHVCIPEYSGELRAKDLEVLRIEQLLADVDQDTPVPAGTETETSARLSPTLEGRADIEASRKRKRKEKKDGKRQQALLDSQAERDTKTYDETLLAVIGVLDEIKLQRNVAAWIRDGGLWGPHRKRILSASDAVAGASKEDISSTMPPSSSPLSPPSSQRDAERSTPDTDTGVEEGTNTTGADRPTRRKEKKRRLRQAKSVEADAGRQAGSDVASTADSHDTAKKQSGSEETPDAVASIWFDSPPTVQYWVERGKRALEELQIPVEHGIDR